MRLRDMADPDEAHLPRTQAANRGLSAGNKKVDALADRDRAETQNDGESVGAAHGVEDRRPS